MFSRALNYSLICFIFSNEPVICLNYAVMLYKCGDRRASAKAFSQFQKKFESYKTSNEGAIDPQVANKLSLFTPFL